MLGFVAIWAASSDRTAVLAVSRAVRAGDAITVDDLAVASITVDPALRPILAADRMGVIGKTATVDLSPGAILVADQLGVPPSAAEGEAIVAVEVPRAAAPIHAIHPGDRVQIVSIAKASGAEDLLGEVIAEGRVTDIASGTAASDATVISVNVAEEVAPTVAGASAAQRAALVLLPRDGG
jgi:hypothetical protein